MATALILVNPVSKGVYAFPQGFAVQAGDELELLEELVDPKVEKDAVLLMRGKKHPMPVYVEKSGKTLYPYVTMADVEALAQ